LTISAFLPSHWLQPLAAYRQPNDSRSLFELAITAVPFTALWLSVWLLHRAGLYWLADLMTIPAAGFLVRLFMIQHDCGHGSFFSRKAANSWVGRTIGVLTMTPYDHWRRSHALHHASCGDLDRRGIGDVDTLTLAEYRASSWWQRLKYRTYRHPIVLFGIGPAILFLFQNRLPFGSMRGGWRPWLSTQSTNVGILCIWVPLALLLGWTTVLRIQLPIMLIAATIGVWLFYVQHQFQDTWWARHEKWDLHEAALYGSSNYQLPPVLAWFSANIGIHHVHHLCSRIPFYRLQRVLVDHPDLAGTSQLTLRQSLATLRLALWDEENNRLVSFRQAASNDDSGDRVGDLAKHASSFTTAA
jgi:omega-6 fatty acid desaturase (delta-12 desaturase)